VSGNGDTTILATLFNRRCRSATGPLREINIVIRSNFIFCHPEVIHAALQMR
jgi:hypothetical protein